MTIKCLPGRQSGEWTFRSNGVGYCCPSSFLMRFFLSKTPFLDLADITRAE
jgi:hypothetical protein